MNLDPAPVGKLAASLMDTIEAEHPGARLRAAMVLVDVEIVDSEGDSWTAVRWHFGSAADDFDNDHSSSAYAAGLAGQAYTALTTGSDEMPE